MGTSSTDNNGSVANFRADKASNFPRNNLLNTRTGKKNFGPTSVVEVIYRQERPSKRRSLVIAMKDCRTSRSAAGGL